MDFLKEIKESFNINFKLWCEANKDKIIGMPYDDVFYLFCNQEIIKILNNNIDNLELKIFEDNKKLKNKINRLYADNRSLKRRYNLLVDNHNRLQHIINKDYKKID